MSEDRRRDVDMECDSGSEWQMVHNSRRKRTRLESKVEQHMHRSCDSETHDRTGARTIPVLSPSIESLGVNSWIFPEN